jgi:hypothetical protein
MRLMSHVAVGIPGVYRGPVGGWLLLASIPGTGTAVRDKISSP